jgi:hypothetical protein
MNPERARMLNGGGGAGGGGWSGRPNGGPRDDRSGRR